MELVGYLLGALEIEEVRRIEQSLLTGATVREHLEVLRLALVPLEADREQLMAPAGLAARTCRRIQEQREPIERPASEAADRTIG